MQQKSNVIDWAKGYVKGYFHNPLTGETCGHFEHHNVISYMAGDIMARMLGDDTTYVPRYMGFIYGAGAAPGAALVEPPSSRTQTWTSLASELSDGGVTGNVLITPFAASPSYAVDGSASNYAGNAVTLTAQSGTRLEYGYPVAAPYSNELADGDYFYHAMLLTRLEVGSTITYMPFARVTLMQGAAYLQKPVGFELALFWAVTYF